MKTVEVSGRTTEEAIQAAAEELGVGTDGVEYEVVEQGSKGFLGLGQMPSVIKAWVREGYTPGAQPAPARPEPEEIAPEPEETAEEAAMADMEEFVEEEQLEGPVAEEPQAQGAAEAGDEFAGAVVKTLGDILPAMQIDAKPVLRSASEDEIVVELIGRDVAILIGKHGQTLDALQYLVGIIANRSVPNRRRVILDAEGYRDRHKNLLERLAHEYAEAVKREGKEAVLEPQAARDRRIVHMALADNPDVYTYSEGEGEDRHVVISPKK